MHFIPHVEDYENLEDVRVNLKRHADGSLSHSVDTWRLAGDRQEEEALWTGITVFVKKLTKDHLHQRLLCLKFEVAPSSPSYATAASVDAAGPAVSMTAHGDRAAGEGGQSDQGEDQGKTTMSASAQLCGSRAQSVRGVGLVPTLQDEAELSALLFEAGRQEERQEGQRDCLCGDGSPPRPQASAQSQGGSSLELASSGDAAGVSPEVESAAAHGDVDSAGTGDYPADVGSTSPSRDDAAVHEQPDRADVHGAADAGNNGTTTTSQDEEERANVSEPPQYH